MSSIGGLMAEKSYNEKYLAAFGLSLRKIRTEIANKSLRLFAYEADIPCATLSRLENGTRIANILTLKKIASALNWQVADLINEIEKNIPEKLRNVEL
ncbi:MAG: helix-turn-helix domain-containing protein [bacterium]|nr:helix-turn-helix domain-containing protein [bacterium]